MFSQRHPDRARDTAPTSGKVKTKSAARGRRVTPSTDAWWPVGRDLLLGVAIFAALWLTVDNAGGIDRAAQFSLGAVTVIGLLLREKWASLAVIVTALATAAAWALGLTADPFLLTGFCLYAMAESRGSRRFPWWLLALTSVVLVGALGLSSEGVEDRFRGALLGAVVLAASWVLGVRTRQARFEAAARSRAEERYRLARDVHDVLSHSLGTIGVRAGVAAHVSTLGESELRAALRDIEDGARTSLTELKGVLQRERADDPSGEPDTMVPSLPLTAMLAEMAQSARQVDLVVTLDLDDDVDSAPAAVRTTVHRIVQEAVTNVIRHASASSLVISVRAEEDHIQVRVADDGRGPGVSVREGHGLTGMRERVDLLGGSLSAESTSPGFLVAATLPLTLTPTHASGGSS